MPSRLQKFASHWIEAAWLAALIIAPLFFDVFSQRVFEPDKIAVLRSLALLALVAWVVRGLDGLGSAGGLRGIVRSAWRKPLVAPVLIVAAAYLISTLFSVTPRASLWGSYQRLQGTFTMLSYMVLFGAALTTLKKREQWQRLQYVIILVSVPIALYGIVQQRQLDPLPWGGDTSTRVAANLGNSIFIAAYLLFAVVLTVERLIAAARRTLAADGVISDALTVGVLAFVLVIQMLAVVFSQSRGPWLGLAAALYVLLLLMLTALRQQSPDQQRQRLSEVAKAVGMAVLGLALVGLGLLAYLQLGGWAGGIIVLITIVGALALYLAPLFRRRGWRWLWLSLFAQAVIVALLLLALNVSPGVFPRVGELPYVGRLTQLTQTESGTGRVRVLIWQGVVEMMLRPHDPLQFPDGSPDRFAAIRPLVGYGPESMWVAYNRFYRPELGDLEARNASPDRSHNETFDSLVITGALGTIAYLFLFASAFYYALRWLNLIRARRDRTVFALLILLGAGAGIAIPVALGRPEFLGVGIAFGFILAAIGYITFAAARGGGAGAAHSLNRNHFVLMALLATFIGYFAEIHFGIAIAATRTYFFVLLAVLAAIGSGQLDLAAPVEPAPEPRNTRPPVRSGRPANARAQAAPANEPSLLRRLLPFIAVTALIFFILAWDFVSNQGVYRDTFTIFWRSWTTVLDPATREPLPGPVGLLMVLFTLLVAALLGLAEVWRNQDTVRSGALAGLALAGAALATWLIYGLVQAARQLPLRSDWTLAQRGDYVANHIVIFFAGLGVMLVLLALSLWFASPPPASRFSAHPALALSAGAVMLLAALFVIGNVNVRLIRADTYFKLGQGADLQRDWANSLILYDRATAAAPQEDQYLLYRGRALLELARSVEDVTRQQSYFNQAEQSLLLAQSLNPLNTDHSANLARFYVSRAQSLPDDEQRDALERKAEQEFRFAIRLSPNSAQLRNDLGTLYGQMGEYDNARERFQQSLALDPNFSETHLRLGQLEATAGNWEPALVGYQRAAELRPNDARAYVGMGFVLSKLNRNDEAEAAYLRALEISPDSVDTLQRLAVLNRSMGDLDDALTFALRVQALLPESDRATIDAFIAEIRQAQSGS